MTNASNAFDIDDAHCSNKVNILYTDVDIKYKIYYIGVCTVKW